MVSKAILRGSKNNSRNIDEFSVLYNTKLSHILKCTHNETWIFQIFMNLCKAELPACTRGKAKAGLVYKKQKL